MDSRAIEEPDVVKTMYENIHSIFYFILLTLQVNAKYVPATVRRRLSSLYYSTMKGIIQQTYHVQYYQSYPDDRSPQKKNQNDNHNNIPFTVWETSGRKCISGSNFYHTHTALSIALSSPYYKKYIAHKV